MSAQRHRLVTRARIATAGLVLAAGSATGLLTVAAAHATHGAAATTTDQGQRASNGSTTTGSGTSGAGSSSGSSSGSSNSGSGGAVAGTHTS